jgi:hypothetical protein
MRNNEFSAWTLLVASAVLGSATMLSLSGCKPPAPAQVDVSTGEYVASNTTASDSNVTTTSSQAVETPLPADDSANNVTAPAEEAKTEQLADTTAEVMSSGGDWPQWGGTRERNNVPGVKNLPLEWNIGKFDRRSGEWDDTKAKNIRWFSSLGSQTYGNPVIASGQVYVGTNNGAGHLKRFPSKVDLGCLLAFD